MHLSYLLLFLVFFFNDLATTEIYTLSLHDALPISSARWNGSGGEGGIRLCRATAPTAFVPRKNRPGASGRSEEHTSELQSLRHLVCRLLLEKKKKQKTKKQKNYNQKT